MYQHNLNIAIFVKVTLIVCLFALTQIFSLLIPSARAKAKAGTIARIPSIQQYPQITTCHPLKAQTIARLTDIRWDRSVKSFQTSPTFVVHTYRSPGSGPTGHVTSKLELKATVNCDVPWGQAHFYDTTTTTFMDITECCCTRINYSRLAPESCRNWIADPIPRWNS